MDVLSTYKHVWVAQDFTTCLLKMFVSFFSPDLEPVSLNEIVYYSVIRRYTDL